MASQLMVRSVPPFRVPGAPAGPLEPPGRWGAARELLDDVELGRARAWNPDRGQDFLAGRLAQRRFAAELLGVPASELTAAYDCPQCGPGSPHGRPGYTLARRAGSAAAEPVPQRGLGPAGSGAGS